MATSSIRETPRFETREEIDDLLRVIEETQKLNRENPIEPLDVPELTDDEIREWLANYQ